MLSILFCCFVGLLITPTSLLWGSPAEGLPAYSIYCVLAGSTREIQSCNSYSGILPKGKTSIDAMSKPALRASTCKMTSYFPINQSHFVPPLKTPSKLLCSRGGELRNPDLSAFQSRLASHWGPLIWTSSSGIWLHFTPSICAWLREFVHRNQESPHKSYYLLWKYSVASELYRQLWREAVKLTPK